MHDATKQAAGNSLRRLFAFNGGFWLKPRLRRILGLSGWKLTFGKPGPTDHIAVWGSSPTAWRGHRVAAHSGAGLVTVEDAFLRSILPGRAAGRIARRGPIGLLIDPLGLHFDPARPSLVETLVTDTATHDLRDAAKEGIDRLRRSDISKYNAHRQELPPPASDYVLVVDQTRGDASLMGAGRARFLEMLEAARQENPGRRIVLRSHPETSSGLRPGHFTRADLRAGEILCDDPVSPWRLVEHAERVYSVSSQLGYEALLAGHRPRLFGQPFYAGWGLSEDEYPLPDSRRGKAEREDLFAASHLRAPVWYDPCQDELTDFSGALDQLEAEVHAYRQDRDGHLAYGIKLWKRPFFGRFFGNGRGVSYTSTPSEKVTLAWAGKSQDVPQAMAIEDGFIRSRGLGAALTPPLSLVADDRGIYYDPTRQSHLEHLISQPIQPYAERRAEKLLTRLRETGVTKYNLPAAPTAHPPKGKSRLILVPGQVENDASVQLGGGTERSNLALLERTRAENPDATIIYKPHPDVLAGLRPGQVADDHLHRLADHCLTDTNPATLLDIVDEVWTITSTLGFEALLREVSVTTLGAPFYAGWGLTRDLGPIPERRQARPSLAALVHACLIAYPRYYDPVSGLPCPVEVALERLADPSRRSTTPGLRILAKLQGALAGHAWIWRR